MTKRSKAADAAPPLTPAPEAPITTTLILTRDQWLAVKLRAAHEGRPLTDICRRALVAYLQTPLQPKGA